MLDYHKLSIRKLLEIQQKGIIYLDEETYFDSSKTIRFASLGSSGRGKTYNTLIVLNQFDNAMFFESKDRAKITLQKQRCMLNWQYYILGEARKSENQFKMNVKDLAPNFSDFHFPIDKKERQHVLIRKFFQKPRDELTYNNLKMLLNSQDFGKSGYSFWNLIEPLLEKNDEALPIFEWMKGKKVFNIIGTETILPAIIILSVINFRKENKSLNWEMDFPLIMGFDELQALGKKNTPTARSIKLVVTQGRQFGVSCFLNGIDLEGVDPGIYTTITQLFIVKCSNTSLEKFRHKWGLTLIIDDINSLPVDPGWCYFINCEDDTTKSIMVRPNTHFLTIKNKIVYQKFLKKEFLY